MLFRSLHITAVGKLFLAEETPDAVRRYAERTGLPTYTRNTLHALPALERELEKARNQGYATDNEEAEVGVRCIAAGIRNDSGVLVAGLSLSAPAERMKPQWSWVVKETAAKISQAIGHPSGGAGTLPARDSAHVE